MFSFKGAFLMAEFFGLENAQIGCWHDPLGHWILRLKSARICKTTRKVCKIEMLVATEIDRVFNYLESAGFPASLLNRLSSRFINELQTPFDRTGGFHKVDVELNSKHKQLVTLKKWTDFLIDLTVNGVPVLNLSELHKLSRLIDSAIAHLEEPILQETLIGDKDDFEEAS
jgi:hypothetical protein